MSNSSECMFGARRTRAREHSVLVVAGVALTCFACSSDAGSGVTSQLGAGTGGGVAGTSAAAAAGSTAGTTSSSGAAGSSLTSVAGSKPTAAGAGGSTTTGGHGGVDASAMDAGTPMMTAGAGAAAGAGAGAAMAGASGMSGMPSTDGCTREMLATAVETYYKALSAHDPKLMSTSPSLKLTQDGKTIMLGEGLMKTAGMVKFTRSALDTLQCETATESVVENAGDDFVVGTRLKVAAGQITEIESILVGPEGWFPNPKAILDSKSDDWEKPLLAESERWTRDKLKKDIVDGYFLGVFGGKIPVADFPFASDCKRSENGFSPGACNFGIPTGMPMTPLHYVVDVEAGIVVGFVLFGGGNSGLDDFHMFHVKSGQVHAVHAVVGPTVSNRGWPTDPAGTQ